MSEDKENRSKRIMEQFERSLPHIWDVARANTEEIILRSTKKSKVVFLSDINKKDKYKPNPFKKAKPFHLLSEEERRETYEVIKNEEKDEN